MLLGCILHYNVCTWVFIKVSHLLFCIFLFSINEILLAQTKKYLLYHTEHLRMVKRKNFYIWSCKINLLPHLLIHDEINSNLGNFKFQFVDLLKFRYV
jgi:hypothetical protein